MSQVSSLSSPVSAPDVLVRVEDVSKKFCLSLKKSLWYGLQDMGNELIGRRHGGHGGLRPKEFWAVRDVRFELKRGESLGLIGHNGAGKTTLLKMLNGLIKPDAGRIEMRGRVGALIALGAGFNPILTGRENIYVNASVLGLAKAEINAKLDEIIDFAEIGEFIDTPVQNYSSGMTVRLGFAVASSLNPDILLLDEVLAVGDMNFQAKCLNRLGHMRAQGTSFILVSHNMVNIVRHCDRVLYMTHGHVDYLGPTHVGVAHYEKDMRSSGHKVNTHITIPDKVAGTGRIAITSIDLLNANGQKCEEINAGSPLKIHVNYIKKCVEEIDVQAEVKIIDSEGILYQHGEDAIIHLRNSAGHTGALTLSMDAVPFNAPRIWISIMLWGPGFTELYDWRKAIQLSIVPWENSTGRIHCNVKTEWHNV